MIRVIRSKGISAVLTVGVMGLLLVPGITLASFVGQTPTVTYSESPYPDLVDNVTVVDPGIELQFNDGSNIGDGIMLDGESIDIKGSSIVFSIRGDGPAYTGLDCTTCQTTGLGPDARYTLSGFDWGGTQSIGSVTVSLNNIFGVALGSEVFFSPTSISLDIGTLGVGPVSGGPDLGTVTLDVTFVPLPAALPLFSTGLVALAGIVWRRRGAGGHPAV
ncbi:MAG TPA: hypothetical protein VEI74_03010 [Candidatus Methylomirabilis sp.]|nr:hypothetical protein [Candidatus Methylomirabilis sp.]